MSRVFITNDTGLDFTRAERYGELVRVTVGPVNVFNPDPLRAEVAQKMADFRQEDYLLLAGAALVVFFASEAIPPEVANVQLLIFDAKKRDYFVRTVDVSQ